MCLATINQTIISISEELDSRQRPSRMWDELSEEALLREAAVCMFSSQMIFEVAEAAANFLFGEDTFCYTDALANPSAFEAQAHSLLSTPLQINYAGKTRFIKPRFHFRLAAMLSKTISGFSCNSTSLSNILRSSSCPYTARNELVKNVCGFGPKQASLFLRRISYYHRFAVLDSHILDYLKLAAGISVKQSSLSRLPAYERIELNFVSIADDLGFSVGSVDLATWITMRVAKREAYI